MSFFRLLSRRFTVRRRTSLVVDSVSLSTAKAADRTPTEPYAVEVEVTYVSGALGTIQVSGTSGGGADSETLSFASLLSAAGTVKLATTMRFDASTAITLTPSGWGVAPTVVARAVRSDGSPLKILYTLQTAWPGRNDRAAASWGSPNDGGVQQEKPIVFLPYSSVYTPREGDELTDNLNGERWRIEGVPIYDDGVAPRHWECEVSRAQT